jgi:hypothetical protein
MERGDLDEIIACLPQERSHFRQTLAWARLDLDLPRGEALTETIMPTRRGVIGNPVARSPLLRKGGVHQRPRSGERQRRR